MGRLSTTYDKVRSLLLSRCTARAQEVRVEDLCLSTFSPIALFPEFENPESSAANSAAKREATPISVANQSDHAVRVLVAIQSLKQQMLFWPPSHETGPGVLPMLI